MKKRVLLLLPLFLGACSDSGESPVITIERLYVNIDGEVDGTAFFTGSKEKRAGFSNIDVSIELEADISDEKRALWLKNVVERCPVSDNIMNMTPVNFNVK